MQLVNLRESVQYETTGETGGIPHFSQCQVDYAHCACRVHYSALQEEHRASREVAVRTADAYPKRQRWHLEMSSFESVSELQEF